MFTQKDFIRWVTLAPLRGDVLVVDLSTFSYQAASQVLGYFLVLEVQLVSGSGTLSVRCKSLGSTDSSLNKDLTLRFNRKEGWLHFCSSNPCIEEYAGDIHVCDVVWHMLAGVENQLIPPAIRSAKKRLSEAEELYWVEESEGMQPEAGTAPGLGESGAYKAFSVEETCRCGRRRYREGGRGWKAQRAGRQVPFNKERYREGKRGSYPPEAVQAGAPCKRLQRRPKGLGPQRKG